MRLLVTWTIRAWLSQTMQILKRLGAELYFAGPEEWRSQEFADYGKFVTIDEVIEEVDVMMFLRVQHERHDYESIFSKENYHRLHGLTQERYDRMKDTAILMHPAPVNRDVEIADHLVEAPKSRIVEQMTNGVLCQNGYYRSGSERPSIISDSRPGVGEAM